MIEVQQIKVLFSLPDWFTNTDYDGADEEEGIEEDMLMFSFKGGCELIYHLCAEGIILDCGAVDEIQVLQAQLEQVMEVIKWRREGLLEPLWS